jgi:LacI family transcriptional regulator
MISASRCRAVLSIHYASGPLFEQLEAEGVRVVLVNNSSYQDRFYSVCVDDFQGAYEGTRYLIELGHRSIAFVEYERPDQPGVIADRYVGFRKALEESRIAFPAERRVCVRFLDEVRLAKKLGGLFARPDRPTAVFAHDDYLGMYVLRILAEMGLAVPGQVSLIAPGDVLDYSLPVTPPITTLRINTALLGRTAATLLLDRLHNDREGVHVLKVKEQLVKRATCARLAQGKAGGTQ